MEPFPNPPPTLHVTPVLDVPVTVGRMTCVEPGARVTEVGATVILTTVKLEELVAVPPGVVTEIGPVATADGATAVIEEAFTTLKLLALVPLNFTAVAPVNAVPVKVTVVPAPPMLGVKDVRVGATSTVKLEELVAVPPAVVTEISPVVTPEGVAAVILVALFTV